MNKNFLLIPLLLSALISCENEEPTDPFPDLKQYAISSLAYDNSENLWVGTDSGLFKIVEKSYQLIEYKNVSPARSLAFDESSNVLWVGTYDGLTKISLSGNPIGLDSYKGENLSNDSINSIYINSDSYRWFGTKRGITLNRSDNWFKEKFKKNLSGTITNLSFESIGVNAITSLDGNYYFATNGQGLYRTFTWNEDVNAFSGATQWLSPYNGTALSDTMYVAFVDSKGQQWFGGTEGIQVHIGDDPKKDNTSWYDELVSPVVHCAAESPDGKIWVGTEKGISIYDGTSWTSLTSNLPDLFVTAIVFNKEGRAIVGTKKGLVILE